MKVFGKKLNAQNMNTFGKKVGSNANIIGRKVLGSVDRIAPLASIGAVALGQPEIAMAIEGGQILAHNADAIGRTGVKALTGKKSNFEKHRIAFGENVEAMKDTTNALLRKD